MKAALIPPIPALKHYGNGDFHLLLSHLLEDPHYFAWYRMQRDNGAYLVLDNSAHENKIGDDALNLAHWARDLAVQEVVVPDCLDDCEGTVDAAVAAHEAWHEGNSAIMTNLDPALMYVPQGCDYAAWQECLSALVNIHQFSSKRYKLRHDFVIGVSKDYEVWPGGILRLLMDDIYPLRAKLMLRGIKVQVHLLGWGRNLWRLEEMARMCPWVRSTDSAKPFVYALKNIDLVTHWEEGTVPEYPTRPKNYFKRKMDATFLDHVALRNVGLFRLLAAGAVQVAA